MVRYVDLEVVMFAYTEKVNAHVLLTISIPLEQAECKVHNIHYTTVTV